MPWSTVNRQLEWVKWTISMLQILPWAGVSSVSSYFVPDSWHFAPPVSINTPGKIPRINYYTAAIYMLVVEESDLLRFRIIIQWVWEQVLSLQYPGKKIWGSRKVRDITAWGRSWYVYMDVTAKSLLPVSNGTVPLLSRVKLSVEVVEIKKKYRQVE